VSIEQSGLVFTLGIRLVFFNFWLIFRKRAISASIVAQQASRRKSRSPKPPKPGNPDLCPLCKEDAAQHLSLRQCLYILTRPQPAPWSQVKGRGGRRKSIDSQGVYCTNPLCAYFAIADSHIHAIVADGHHGKDNSIQNWQCQACGHHVTDRYGSFLYRLKKPLLIISNTLAALNDGQSVRAAARSHSVNKDTAHAWYLRFGQRAPALWLLIAQANIRVGAIQLDELYTMVKKKNCHLSELEHRLGTLGSQWVWTAMDPVHKLLLIALVGSRTRNMACIVIHNLLLLLAPGCVPAFSSDGLKFYFVAISNSRFGFRLDNRKRLAYTWSQ